VTKELPPPGPRRLLHRRSYLFEGYVRPDGLYDLEGRIVDRKSYAFDNHDRGTIAAGEPLHDMSLRLTLDEDYRIHDAHALSRATPFSPCPEVAANYRRLIGQKIGSGWRGVLRELVGGIEGCTHLSELAAAMGTVAFQTIAPLKLRRQQEQGRESSARRSPLIDSCHGFRADGPVVKRLWPNGSENGEGA